MSHSTPPDDPTELLKAFFRHIESHLEENSSLSEPEAKQALQQGLAALTGMSEDRPDISVLEGGLSDVPLESEAQHSQEPPVLSIHNKIESADSDAETQRSPLPFRDFQLDSGAHVSVHIVNAEGMGSLLNGETVEQGHIRLSAAQPTQTVFFGKDIRHVRIYCSEGAFEVGTEDGPVGLLHLGQSIDVEGPCVFVTATAEAVGHYVMIDAHGFEW